MEMTEFLKEEMTKSLREIQENRKKLEEINKFHKEDQENGIEAKIWAISEVNLKNEIENCDVLSFLNYTFKICFSINFFLMYISYF